MRAHLIVHTQEFFNDNKSSYIEPEKAKVKYLLIDAESLKESIEVSQSEIQFEYEDYLSGFDSAIRIHLNSLAGAQMFSPRDFASRC